MCICIQRVNDVYIAWMLCVYYRWRLAPQDTLSCLLFYVLCVRYFEIVAASSAHELMYICVVCVLREMYTYVVSIVCCMDVLCP